MRRGDDERDEAPRRTVTGLTDGEARRTAAEYFDRFAWDPPALDPHRMSAAEFLAGL